MKPKRKRGRPKGSKNKKERSGGLHQRSEADNVETLNRLLNLYDDVLEWYAPYLIAELGVSQQIDENTKTHLDNFKVLASMIDALMKRWYIVHRGYDTNTRQAQEDAKAKTVKREKQAEAELPAEERIKVIRSYDETMRDLTEGILKEMNAEERKV